MGIFQGLKSINQNIPIGFGAASISGEGGGYGFGQISLGESQRLIEYAYEKGVRIFDTAPIYGHGESERRLGLSLKKVREKVFIVSKSGVHWHPNKRVNMTNDPKVALEMLEQSRQRLETDYIDLYMVHWPDKNVDIRRVLEVLEREQSKGKILHLGLCNSNEEDMEKAKEVAKIQVAQSELNVFNYQRQREFLDYLEKNKIDFMSWGTLDKGILTGTVQVHRKFDEVDARSWAPWWKSGGYQKKMKVMERVLPYFEKKGWTGLQLALGHNLRFAQVKNLLCGFKSIKQLDEIISALNTLPPSEVVDEYIFLVERELENQLHYSNL